MRERGSALLTAIIAVLLLFLISGIFFSLVINRYRLETSEEKILKAYNMAESGINFEVADLLQQLQANHDIQPTVPTQLPTPPVSPFGAGYGSYTINSVTFSLNNASVTVTSTGSYLGVHRTLTEQYAIPIKSPNS